MKKIIQISVLITAIFVLSACSAKGQIPKKSPCACYDIIKVS